MSKKFSISILAHNIRSLYNVGSFFRTCDAVGVEKLFLTGYTGHPRTKNDPRKEWDIIHVEKKILKTGLSGFDSVDWEYYENPLEILEKLKNGGVGTPRRVPVQIVAVEEGKGVSNVFDFDWKFPVCLIVGNEVTGVPQEILNIADAVVEIPMYGAGKSLNVGVALGVVVYQAIASEKRKLRN